MGFYFAERDLPELIDNQELRDTLQSSALDRAPQLELLLLAQQTL